jgi:hypothetical protein
MVHGKGAPAVDADTISQRGLTACPLCHPALVDA